MRIGLQVPYTPKHLALVEALGLDRIQLRVGPGFPVDTGTEEMAEAMNVADILAERGITVSSLGFYRNMLAPNRAERDDDIRRFRNVMRMAEVFQAGVIGVFAGRDPELAIPDNIPVFREVWAPLAREAADHGLRIAFENCTMFRGYPVRGINMCHTPRAYEMMFEALPAENIGIEFDPSHLLKQLIDPLGFVRRFPGRIFHVHAKDHERLEDMLQLHGCYDMGVSRDRFPGNGEVDFEDIVAELRIQGYDGDITIEGERDPDYSTEQEIAEGLRKAVEHLEYCLQ